MTDHAQKIHDAVNRLNEEINDAINNSVHTRLILFDYGPDVVEFHNKIVAECFKYLGGNPPIPPSPPSKG